MFIYQIWNIDNGKRYIGQTGNPNNRKRKHFAELRRQSHWIESLQNDYNAHPDSLLYMVIEIAPPDQATEREIFWIKKFKSIKKGYNKVLPMIPDTVVSEYFGGTHKPPMDLHSKLMQRNGTLGQTRLSLLLTDMEVA